MSDEKLNFDKNGMLIIPQKITLRIKHEEFLEELINETKKEKIDK